MKYNHAIEFAKHIANQFKNELGFVNKAALETSFNRDELKFKRSLCKSSSSLIRLTKHQVNNHLKTEIDNQQQINNN